MKIAVFHELPPGGAMRAVNDISQFLKKKGHTVDLYTLSECFNKNDKEHYSHLHITRFLSKKWTGGDWKTRLYKDTFELCNLFLTEAKIARSIRKGNYDLVFINASKFIETPFILRFSLPMKIFYLHDPNYRMIYDENAMGELAESGIRQVYE